MALNCNGLFIVCSSWKSFSFVVLGSSFFFFFKTVSHSGFGGLWLRLRLFLDTILENSLFAFNHLLLFSWPGNFQERHLFMNLLGWVGDLR